MGEEQPADAVFGLLSDGTRIDVLRAIATAQRECEGVNSDPAALSFSEIYDRVDVDSTSKLSYHLGELAGTFLRKSDEGYTFTHAGDRLTRFVLARNYERPTDFGPTETSGTCPFCGDDALNAALDDQYFVVRCASCGRPVAGHWITPAQARSREGAALVRSVKRKQAADYRQVRHGTCPQCAGRLSTEVVDASDTPLPDADAFLAVDRCEECLRQYSGPLTYGVAYHPASIAFHWERGVDVTAKGMWEFHEHLYEGRWTSERLSSDSGGYEAVLRRGDDALRVRLDSSATVTRTERVRRRNVDERRSR